MRARLLQIVHLTERAVRREVEIERPSGEAIVEERTRIARELHDIVSHGLSVMVVQAAGAESALEDAPWNPLIPGRAAPGRARR